MFYNELIFNFEWGVGFFDKCYNLKILYDISIVLVVVE